MFYKYYRPIPELTPFIEYFWVIRSLGTPGVVPDARMPADGRATLLLSFAGKTRMREANGLIHHLASGVDVLGAHAQSYVLEHEGDTELIAAQFRPGGLAPFIRCHADELSGQSTPLDLVWGREAARLLERVFDATSTPQKVEIYQHALLGQLRSSYYQERVSNALRQIETDGRETAVPELAYDANLSQKQFERVFLREVGMLPKRYIRLSRFQRMVRALRTQVHPTSWTDFAIRFGYYDHSHMIKDFQEFAGTQPTRFSAETAGIVEVVYSDQTTFQ